MLLTEKKLDPGLAERFISLFTRMERNEGKGVLVLFANGFLLLLAYYLLKPVRESLILTENNAEVRSYAVAAIACVLVVLVPVYSFLFRRYGRDLVVRAILLFFIGNLFILATLVQGGYQIGFVFFVWQGIFSVTAITQFWAFAADLYTPEQGKRLFPLIAAGVSLGAWLGSEIAAKLFSVFGPYGLMLTAACVLCMSFVLTQLAQRIVTGRQLSSLSENLIRKPCLLGGYSLVAKDQYLRLIAVTVVLLNWINSTGDFILAKAILDHVNDLMATDQFTTDRSVIIGSIYSRYYATVTLLGLVIQLLLVSRLFRMIGVGGAALIIPTIMILGYALISFVPIFTVIYLYQTLENSGNYSLHNTARHAMFLPIGQAARFEGKTTIETCFWRIGDLIQAGTIYIGSNLLDFNLSQFALANLVLAAVFLWVSAAARKRYLEFLPDQTGPSSTDSSRNTPSRLPLPGNVAPTPQIT